MGQHIRLHSRKMRGPPLPFQPFSKLRHVEAWNVQPKGTRLMRATKKVRNSRIGKDLRPSGIGSAESVSGLLDECVKRKRLMNSDVVDRFFVQSYILESPRPQGPSTQSQALHLQANEETIVKRPAKEAIPLVEEKQRKTSVEDVVPVDNDLTFVPSPGVRKLLDSLREATLKASGGEPIEFSEAERKAWEAEHPCRSRAEMKSLYAERKHMKGVPVNKQWDLVYSEYEKLHRTCIKRVGDLQYYFASKNTSIACNFLIAEPHFGLGNKLFHTSSAFLYAILTQRVMVIPDSTDIPELMCEPFAGSSWGMSEGFYNVTMEMRNSSENFWKAVDSDKLVGQGKGTLGSSMYASSMNDAWVGPEPRFWCNTEQKYMNSVTWLSMSGCTLFAHKLFAIGMFREILEDLFPNKVVLTHLLRSLLLPGDSAWERILHVNEVYLSGAEKQVGVQVRFFQEDEEYQLKNDRINKRITKCMWENKILPEVCPASPRDKAWNDPKFAQCKTKMSAKDHENPQVIKVLVGSLFLGLHDHLNDIYLRHEMTTTKEAVGIIQLTHELMQGSGVEVDTQALVEIISLSMSDVLLITPMSTFGGVIHGYGGLIPWFIEFGPEEDPPVVCQKGKGIEPCYMGASQYYQCPYDDVGKKKISEVVPYLQNCLAIDVEYGYKLNMIPQGYGMQMTPDNIKDQDFYNL
ncbi:hypothetical protein R1flu_026101 [Riccia fluitans]|uniref:Fucosyltransferase n=1 Tax=Riccia fluitans TaxID=41844 RepID=A0ABD1XJ13_9MARC